MSAQCDVTLKAAAGAPMSVFERYLTVWVFLCILAGVTFGQLAPGVFQAVGRMEVAQVNLPVGLLIWVMVIPMLVKVDFGALHEVKGHVRGIGVTLFVNWLVKPFSMAFLGWLFVRNVFAPMLPAEQLDSYIAGLILLAAAPCTAMVFVWSRLSNGDPLFTLSQVWRRSPGWPLRRWGRRAWPAWPAAEPQGLGWRARKRSSAPPKACRSAWLKAAGPPVCTPLPRSSSRKLRIDRRSAMLAAVYISPRGFSA